MVHHLALTQPTDVLTVIYGERVGGHFSRILRVGDDILVDIDVLDVVLDVAGID